MVRSVMKRLDDMAAMDADTAARQGREALFRDMPRLETPRLTLRAPKMEDAQDMYAYSRDPEVARYVLWDAHRGLWDTRAYLRAVIRRNRQGGPGTFAIAEKASGRMIGTIGFMWIDADHRSAEVGYSLARDCWNRGYATEALRETLRFAFEQLGLNRVEGQCDVRNPASGRVMAHAGMRYEGRLRERIFLKGEYADVRLYALLHRDWLALTGSE